MLYPQAQAANDHHAQLPSVTAPGIDLDAVRAADLAAERDLPREPVDHVGDVQLGGVRCRLFRPAGARDLVVHFHGGGFVFNDIDVHDRICRTFANASGMAILSVDYRRPPESKFPAAVEDVDAVIGALPEFSKSNDLTGSWFIHGDSAGGNLALVGALHHREAFAGVALIYPFIDASMSGESYLTAEVAFDPAEAAWYWEQYAASPEDYTNPDFSPFAAENLEGLPPTLVVTAEGDPLRAEGEDFAQRCADAGVKVTATRFLGQVHGFWRHQDAFDAAAPLMAQVIGFLRLHI